MSNSDGLIRSYVDRILRLKEEAKAVNDDIREVYAEAKGEGLDKTALGKLVNYVEKRSKDAAAVAESEAIFELYLSAYYGTGTPVATHAHAPEGVDTIDTPDHDPETGEVIEHSSQVVSSAELPAADAPPTPSAGTGGEADRQPIASFPAAVEASGATRVIDVGGGGEAQSTAARKDVREGSVGETAGREMAAQPDLVHAPQAGTQAPPVDTVQEPGSEGLGVPGREVTLQGPAPEPQRQWTHADPAHPDCLNPSQCGGFSNFARCDACKAAANMQVA